MQYQEVIEQVSRDNNIDSKVLLWYIRMYFLFMKTKLSKEDLKLDFTEEEFKKKRLSFNLAGLGKIGCPYSRHKKLRELHGSIQKKTT